MTLNLRAAAACCFLALASPAGAADDPPREQVIAYLCGYMDGLIARRSDSPPAPNVKETPECVALRLAVDKVKNK